MNHQELWDHALARAWICDGLLCVAMFEVCEQVGFVLEHSFLMNGRKKADVDAFYALNLKRAPKDETVAWHGGARRWVAIALPRMSKALFDAVPKQGNYRLSVNKVAAFMARFDDDPLSWKAVVRADKRVRVDAYARHKEEAEVRRRESIGKIDRASYEATLRNNQWGITK